ncbi:S-adenosyl-L-methionine-dependent methyltransferase [Pholiota conissans]|uniref:S-adenosyl-L-methionine-dependent methyltransferase n=1 Tax=Pholiota conissans TaxID=109636 RepID=A0A9P6D0M8_9AGAR|nr:S-adenosyl-L-methionine-dependent methyltransferase [Pholiota conissans]
MDNIRLLRAVLNESLDALEAACASKSVSFPSLDEPYVPNSDSEILCTTPDICAIIDKTVAASYQLICTIRHPFLNLADASSGYHLAACLRVAEKFNLPEILKAAGPFGLHVDSIALKAHIEATKLARILRVLATHHIFKEVRPDIFANNRISSYFSTSKTAEEIQADPAGKYRDNSDAAAAGYIGTFTDDVFKASSYLLEDLEDEHTGRGFSSTAAAFQKALDTQQDYFSWLEKRGNEYRFTRYGACIQGTSLWDPPDTVIQGFDWASIGRDGIVVDVGGGLGAPSMILAKTFRDLQIIIQDRPAVVSQAEEFWRKSYPDGFNSGRISFMAHDFFEPQPVQGPSIFLVRTICHDWPDELVVKILSNLRSAAKSSTRLIMADFVLPYACPVEDIPTSGLEQTSVSTSGIPSPLLSNLGKAGFNAYYIDMTMQVLLNGQERTLSHQVNLASKAGWEVTNINRIRNSYFGYLVAGPLPAK